MDKEFEGKVYAVISEFMISVNSMDAMALQEKFGVTAPVLDEMVECLGDYFGRKLDISPAPADVAFSGKIGSRPYIDVYEMNDAKTWGVECVIWVDGKAAEPILHVELFDKGGSLGLRYKYIGS
ncbi:MULTISPECIES: hypothetical protein [Burkholderia]|uniref:hypothetical protein n=1 Tax=Burkholderia TaxID=32008 RepID=UPI000B79B4E8|nr:MULTISPECIES: hypothetical protein [Burkholderia]MBY4726036.1 hypothetical protein [Burkholderia contaminans]MCI3971730.1 hypothetical protein [Burkholderia sp. HI4860]MDN7792419.1 hypothetical protein [Burkholderia contaminans]OXJ05952.1 hypothetical protein CFB48_01940 [Burkholderia sp. AU33647]